MADLQKTNALLGAAGDSMSGFGTITAPTAGATTFTTASAPTFSVGDKVTSGANTYYVKSVDTDFAGGGYGFELSLIPGGTALTGTTGGAGFTAFATSTPTFQTAAESLSSDLITGAAGLQNIKLDLDAEATIAANSTVKSAAVNSNVTGDSASLADIGYNSGLQSSADTANLTTIDVASDAGISGIATTTGSASASTSAGTASAFAALADAAGIQDLDRLTVGGELTGLGKSLNTLSATAENVVGASNAASELSTKIEGFEGAQMGISSNASLQGLAQFSNTAAASTSTGNADAEAFAQQLQGADLTGLKVGGTANVTGQATLSNLSAADAVTGNAEATSQMGTGGQSGAQGLVASGATFTPTGGTESVAGIQVASDAGLTGLASITNNATAKTSAGSVDADAIGSSIQGANLNTVQIGGVGTIGGQATYSAKATAENVNGGYSDALADLASVDGLVAGARLDIKSDATIQGLASINNDAMASGTAASDSGTGFGSQAIAEANTLIGANLATDTDIGGIGSITGQVNFGSKATAENVTGKSLASASLGEQTAAGTFAPGKFTLASATQGSGGTDNLFTTTDTNKSNLSAGDKVTVSGVDYFVTTADASAGTFKLASSLDNALQGTALTAAQLTSAGISGSSFTTSTLVNNEGGLAQGLVSGTDATTAFGTEIKSDATVKGLSTINLQAAASTTNGVVDADAYAGKIEGANLGDLNIGGIGSIQGQANFSLKADGSNVNGGVVTADAKALESNGLIGSASQTTVNPATVSSYNATTGVYTTGTYAGGVYTAGSAPGVSVGDLIKVGGSTVVVKDVTATGFTTANPSDGNLLTPALGAGATGAIDIMNAAVVSGNYGLNVASDSTVSGLNIGSLKATASSTANDATATSGAATAIGADLPSLNVGGLANLTGAAQVDAASTAESVSGVSTASAGIGQAVTGLTSLGEVKDLAWAAAAPTKNSDSQPASLSSRAFDNDLNVKVASDATLTAKGFSNLDATATSTAGAAVADAGNTSSTVTGIAAGMDINVGGVGNLTALAQGTADASATSVTGKADAFSAQSALGINQLEMKTASDDTISSSATVVGNANAMSTGDGNPSTDTAWAAMDFDATGINGLAMQAGGIGNLTAMGSVTGNAMAEGVASTADARGDIDAMGLQDAWFSSASDGSITGIGKVIADVSATSTANTAKAEGDFDATGIQTLEAGIGGISILKGQAQVKADMSAESVSGDSTAYSGVELPGAGGGAFDVDFTNTAKSSVIGLSGIELKGASDGTILGTASGAFDTSAESMLGNANAQASQILKGISTLNLDLGGNGGISAIVQDTNFVSASSVSGNATSVATVDAIGLDGGNIHIAGNATITATVGVDSKSESHTVS
jgi:hypothetical protein